MPDEINCIRELVKKDPRYPVDAYLFVRAAVAFADDSIQLGSHSEFDSNPNAKSPQSPKCCQRHMTGQELCEAIRQYAINQFGYMAKVVLHNWGIEQTNDFGAIVYNMINVGLIDKSNEDRRSHFDHVYDFDSVFESEFEIGNSLARRR